MSETVTINSMQFHPQIERMISAKETEPTTFDLGKGRHAAVYLVGITHEGLLVSTSEPEGNGQVISRIGQGNVVWGCIPALKVDGKKDESIEPDSGGYFLLKYENSYGFELPTGYGERVTHLYREP